MTESSSHVWVTQVTYIRFVIVDFIAVGLYRMGLKSQLVLRFLVAIAVFGALLFIPAGSFAFWQGWAYLNICFVSGLFAFVYFYKHDPELIRRRTMFKEKVREQKRIMALVYVIWPIVFSLPGLDHRYGWSRLPLWLTVLAQAVVLAGYWMTFWVAKVNRFAARTIQVEPDQTVVSTGPYSVVRHPMYLGMCLIWLFTPLALSSYITLPAFALFIPLIILRLLNEEKVLCQELPGYPEYCSHTHYHLVPYVW